MGRISRSSQLNPCLYLNFNIIRAYSTAVAQDNLNAKISILPALIVAYKRLENTEKLMNDCIKFGCPKIYIAVDKSTGSENFQREFYELASKIHERTSIPIYLWNREENYGLAASVFSAISWFFEFEEAGYILEDDLEVSESFFLWSSALLDKLHDDDHTWLVSGNNYQDNKTVQSTNYPLIWGWATSRTKWEQILKSVFSSAPTFNSSTHFKVRTYWALNYKKAAVGTVDSWAMLLAATMRANNKSCILPPTNMVSNLGSDLAATHTQQNVWPLRQPIENLLISFIDETVIPTESADEVNEFIEKRIYGLEKIKYRWVLKIALLKFRKNSKLQNIRELMEKDSITTKFEMRQ